MAEPVNRGTIFSRPFTNQFVDILHEDLKIVLDEKFEFANFEILYHINASKDGIKIPLLFYASEMTDNFSVEVDGKPVAFSPIPYEFQSPANTKFSDFTYFFDPHLDDNSKSMVLVEESPSTGFYVNLNDLYFFETDISKGEHTIKVTYTASSWTDQWNWVNEYSFRYALSPAKYWKSFGSLSVTLDAGRFNNAIKTNLGEPSTGTLDSVATWNFHSLPTEVLIVSYTPEINKLASILIQIRPDRLAYIFGLLLVLIHFFLIRSFRKKHPEKKFSLVVIFGSIFVPLLFFLSWSYFYSIIDSLIGEHASGKHGYSQLVFIFFPVVIPFYWLVAWVIDRFLKRNMVKNTDQNNL